MRVKLVRFRRYPGERLQPKPYDILGGLDDRQLSIVKLIHEGYSIKDIAESFRLSRVRIQQIQSKTLRMVQNNINKQVAESWGGNTIYVYKEVNS